MEEHLLLIDTHCHLDAAEFAPDRDEVVARARQAGVACLVVPAVEAALFADVEAVCLAYPECAPAYGLHPMYVGRHQDEHLTLLRQRLQHETVVAVGEIGLDGFVAGLDFARQEQLFVEQLKLAREFDLPVILHIRRAQDTILKHLRRMRVRGGIAHAFNGSAQQADEFIKLGFRLGFGGAMTYPRALNLQRLAATLPLEAIVLETDAPDIPPVSIRGQRNEPAKVAEVADSLARLRNLEPAALIAATGNNALDVLPRLRHWRPHA